MSLVLISNSININFIKLSYLNLLDLNNSLYTTVQLLVLIDYNFIIFKLKVL